MARDAKSLNLPGRYHPILLYPSIVPAPPCSLGTKLHCEGHGMAHLTHLHEVTVWTPIDTALATEQHGQDQGSIPEVRSSMCNLVLLHDVCVQARISNAASRLSRHCLRGSKIWCLRTICSRILLSTAYCWYLCAVRPCILCNSVLGQVLACMQPMCVRAGSTALSYSLVAGLPALPSSLRTTSPASILLSTTTGM